MKSVSGRELHVYEAAQVRSPSVRDGVFNGCAKKGSAHVSGPMLESVGRGPRHEADVNTSKRCCTAFCPEKIVVTVVNKGQMGVGDPA